jgi:diguanylate cyclase
MRSARPSSLASSITFVVLAASTIALSLFTVVSIWLDHESAIGQLDARISTLADVMGQNSAAALDFSDKQAATSVLEALRSEPHVMTGCLYNLKGDLFAEYHRDVSANACPDSLAHQAMAGGAFRGIVRPALHRHEAVGSVFLSSDLGELEMQEQRLIGTSLLLGLVSIAFAGVSGSFFQHRITKPIGNLARSMHKVTAEESFDAHVQVEGCREIAELGVGFNTMLNELNRRDQLAKLADARLHDQARTDSLTGLPNRRLFSENLDKALAAARRGGGIVGLLYIDLDGFKLVNDSLGHSVGDLLLCEVASRINSRVRQSDTLARVGGDEFTVILTSLKCAEDAGTASGALLDCLTRPFHVEGHEITVGASIGISTLENPTDDSVDLLRQADSAMYAAKRNGRNRAVYFSDDLSLTARERLTLENQLRGAIERGELHVHYQPEFDAVSGQLVRFEALARWTHPIFGDVPPGKFIPIAEETGLIHSIGSHILNQACHEAVSWQSHSETPIQVAVNVSVVQFSGDSIIKEIRETLARTGLAPRLLQIELTESVMMGSFQRSAEKMRALHELGISIALDDFGTGYSCLSYLHELPFSAIKLDRSFVAKLAPSFEANTIMRSIVTLAHGMSMRVIVEGVEEESQLRMVNQLGADEVQGFLLGRPGPNPSQVIKRFRCAQALRQSLTVGASLALVEVTQ